MNTKLRTDYYVTYKFDADGQEYLRERRVSEAFHNSLSDNENFPIRYLPDDPENNHIDRNWISWSIIGPAVVAIFFFCTGYVFRRVAIVAANNAAARPGSVDQGVSR